MKSKYLILGALVVLAPAIAAASSLDVNADAAMGNSSSSACGVAGAGCGLELLVTSPASAAFVQSDHMSIGGNETAVRISFIVDAGHPNPADPDNLLSVAAPGHIRAGIGFEDFTPGTGTKLIVFVRRNGAGTAWRLHVWTRDSNTQAFIEAGSGFLSGGAQPITATRVDIEWTAGNGNGIVRVTRDVDDGVANPIQIFENTNLNMNYTLGTVRFGDPGFGSLGSPTGSLYLDEFVISRL